MALKQLKDGSWQIASGADLEAAVAAVEERTETLDEIEKVMEEEYGYSETKAEVKELTEAIRIFMSSKDVKNVFRDKYKLTLVKRARTSWDGDKLKSLLPKNMFIKVSRLVVDPEKIDDLVRRGEIDSKKIESALVSIPEKPHVRSYPYKEGQDKDDAMDEERRLMDAMQGEAKKKSGSKRKMAKA